MAPPPPASMPLGERLAALAQTLQFAWFAGHVTLLLSTLRYGLSYITFNFSSRWASFSYRTAFLSACVTYGIVVYKAYRARMRAGKQSGVVALATDENVQYLIMALTWLFSRQIPLAILPFSVYSIFHVANDTKLPASNAFTFLLATILAIVRESEPKTYSIAIMTCRIVVKISLPKD